MATDKTAKPIDLKTLKHAVLVREHGHWIAVHPEVLKKDWERWDKMLDNYSKRPDLAEKTLRSLVEFYHVGWLEAINYLSKLLPYRGDYIGARALAYQGYMVAQWAIPQEFQIGKDELSWHHTENRPIFRALYNYGHELSRLQLNDGALELFSWMLQLDGHDPMGARYQLHDLYVKTNRFDDILTLAPIFKGAYSEPRGVISPAYALFMLGKKEAAVNHLRNMKDAGRDMVQQFFIKRKLDRLIGGKELPNLEHFDQYMLANIQLQFDEAFLQFLLEVYPAADAKVRKLK